jgi:hypothetical protein
MKGKMVYQARGQQEQGYRGKYWECREHSQSVWIRTAELSVLVGVLGRMNSRVAEVGSVCNEYQEPDGRWDGKMVVAEKKGVSSESQLKAIQW